MEERVFFAYTQAIERERATFSFSWPWRLQVPPFLFCGW